MKKQHTSNQLAFTKAVVTELNDASLSDVHGGSSATISIAVSIYFVTIKVIEYIQEQQ